MPHAIARHLDAGDMVLVPHIGYSPTGEVFNLSWEDVARERRGGAEGRQAAAVHRPPAHRPQGRGAGRADRARGRGAAEEERTWTPHTARALRARARARSAPASGARTSSRGAPRARCCSSCSRTPGVGTMITADPVEQLRAARIEDVRRHPRADRAAGGRRHAGQAQPRAARARDRQLPRGRARRRDRRLRRAVSLRRGQEPPSSPASRWRPTSRDAGHGERLLHACEERAQGAEDAQAVRAHHARRALVPRAGLPRRRRPPRCPASARRSTIGDAARRYSSSGYRSRMARTVKCIKLGREAEGLDFPPYPGALGKRICENVSKEAWRSGSSSRPCW